MNKLSTFSTMFAAVLISLLSVNLYSQELEVTPGTLMFKTNPGSSQTQQIFVRNKAKTEQSFVFNLGDWLTDEQGEVKYLAPGTTARSCADWITVSPSLVTLQPNESVKVNVTMLVPNDNSSTKWAVLFVQSAVEKTGAKAIDKDVQMGLKVAARIAIPIYQSPDVNQLYKGTINGLTETVNDDGTRTYKTQVINTGDKILNCKVYFTVQKRTTRKLARFCKPYAGFEQNAYYFFGNQRVAVNAYFHRIFAGVRFGFAKYGNKYVVYYIAVLVR